MATRVFAAWCGSAALVVLSGQHRVLYAVADGLGIPEMVVAVLTGATGLAWYEVAYAIGRGLNSAWLFVLLPYLGVVAGLAAAAGLLAGRRWLLRGVSVQVACAVIAGGLALAFVAGRAVLGYPDRWRLAALASFAFVQGAWGIHLLRLRRSAVGPAARMTAGRTSPST